MRDVSASSCSTTKHRAARGEPAHAGRGEPDVGGVLGRAGPQFCTLHGCSASLAAPSIARRERDGLDLLPKQYEVFWEAFAEAVDTGRRRGRARPARGPGAAGGGARRAAARPSSTATSATSRSGSTATASCCSTGASRPRATRWSTTSGPSEHYAWRIDATHDELWEDFRARARRARRPARGRARRDRRTRDVRLDPRPQRRHPPRSGRAQLGPRRARAGGCHARAGRSRPGRPPSAARRAQVT